jgi:hypothetical protein
VGDECRGGGFGVGRGLWRGVCDWKGGGKTGGVGWMEWDDVRCGVWKGGGEEWEWWVEEVQMGREGCEKYCCLECEAVLVMRFGDQTIWTIQMTILNDDDGGISIRYTMSERGLHIFFNLTFWSWALGYTIHISEGSLFILLLCLSVIGLGL